MIDRPIPRDISKYKAKLMLGLTTRQVVLFIPAAGLAVLAYMLLHNVIGELAFLVAMVVALPFLLFAAFKPLGMPLEKFLKKALVPMFLAPAKRRYQASNTYTKAFKDINNEALTPAERAKAQKKTKKFVSKIPENKAI